MLALQSEKKLDFRVRGPRVARSQRRPFRPPLVWSHLLALLVVGYHCACVLWCESEREGVGIAPLRSCAPAYPQGASWRIRTPWNVAGTYQGAPGSSSEAPGSLREPQRALESPWKALESSGELWKALRSFGKPTYNMAGDRWYKGRSNRVILSSLTAEGGGGRCRSLRQATGRKSMAFDPVDLQGVSLNG